MGTRFGDTLSTAAQQLSRDRRGHGRACYMTPACQRRATRSPSEEGVPLPVEETRQAVPLGSLCMCLATERSAHVWLWFSTGICGCQDVHRFRVGSRQPPGARKGRAVGSKPSALVWPVSGPQPRRHGCLEAYKAQVGFLLVLRWLLGSSRS